MPQATVETRVRFAETDAMGVTYHGNYLPWFEMARVALLDQLGCPYRELEKQGFLLPVLETGLTYHRPSYFDDRVRITVTLAEKPRARLHLTYKVERGTNFSSKVSPCMPLLAATSKLSARRKSLKQRWLKPLVRPNPF